MCIERYLCYVIEITLIGRNQRQVGRNKLLILKQVAPLSSSRVFARGPLSFAFAITGHPAMRLGLRD